MVPEREEIARIVVCEDDEATQALLAENLVADRYGVETAPTAADALRLCQFWRPDILLLDLNLPDASGLDVLREVREPDRSVSRFDPGLAVIVLSGRGTERDRVRGLQQGADDYLVKPFHYPELLARIEAVRRRRVATRPGPTRVAEIEISREERTVSVGGRPVALSAKEFSLLSTLASEPTRVFPKEELLRDVWGYRSIGHTRTLEAHASRLRRKLDPERGRFVVNCWGVGYRLVEP
jgi:DNA-binding response OmpR family regulator